MKYKTVIIGNITKARKMAAEIEIVANSMAKEGWALVTFSITNSQKAILVFSQPNGSKKDEEKVVETVQSVGDDE